MTELVYPIDLPPRIPSRYVRNSLCPEKGLAEGDKEIFPVVEESGLVVGRSERWYCHSGAKVLHPVVHLHIIDRYGRLCLQKRSMKKDIQPGRWDTAVGGHVSYGETLVEALYREAGEEIGLTKFNPIYLKSYVFESEIEKELVNVFAAVGSYDLNPDHSEVDELKFWEYGEIDENFGKSVFTPNFEHEFQMVRQSLMALL